MLIGILGAGQLGRMLALAGYPLGLQFRFLDPTDDAPAEQVAQRIAGPFDDEPTLERFSAGLDLVTYEFENVPVSTVRFLQTRVPVFPPPAALETSQDRLVEKNFFRSLGIPTSPFRSIQSRAELETALVDIGLPAVLKTRTLGYDGKGQMLLEDFSAAGAAWTALGGQPLLLEGFISFERELSIVAVRARSGATAFYPLVENRHEGGILRLSIAPSPHAGTEIQQRAETYAKLVLEKIDYVGVLAIEFFECQGQLLANEMAPRVHNSGHWTIEGAETSQFENHLRAILDLPLGSTAPVGYSAMVNLIGNIPDRAEALAVPGAHLHLYGKSARPARKLGHITVRAEDRDTLRRRLEQLTENISEMNGNHLHRREPAAAPATE